MISIVSSTNDLTLRTAGLGAICGYELQATVCNVALRGCCSTFLEYVATCIKDGYVIQANDTFQYGYWVTKLIPDENNDLIFWELKPDATDFVLGVSSTLTYWQNQYNVCLKSAAKFDPITPDQMIAISDGVYEGDAVEGVRYPAPAHMSGWYLTTNRYDGDISSLKVVHAYHVSERRPDLAKFFALPCGYRFQTVDNDVWFDKTTLTS